MLKDPKISQLEISIGYAWIIADKIKAFYDREAANEMKASDKNGDGKVSREEMMARLENSQQNLFFKQTTKMKMEN